MSVYGVIYVILILRIMVPKQSIISLYICLGLASLRRFVLSCPSRASETGLTVEVCRYTRLM